MTDIVDTSNDHETSHKKLKINCLANEQFLNGKGFTKPNLLTLCDTYSVQTSTNTKKKRAEIASALLYKIINSEKMINATVYQLRKRKSTNSRGHERNRKSQAKERVKDTQVTSMYASIVSRNTVRRL